MKDLENQFNEAAKAAMEKIQKHIDKANEELDKAVKVSEEYGVPFYSSISPLSQAYKPGSFAEKWASNEDESDDDLDDEDDSSDDDNKYYIDEYSYLEYEGWQHSAVCF